MPLLLARFFRPGGHIWHRIVEIPSLQNCDYHQLIDIVSAYITAYHPIIQGPGEPAGHREPAIYVHARLQVSAISVISQGTVFLNNLSMRLILNIDDLYGVTGAQFMFDHWLLGDYLFVEYTETRGPGGLFPAVIRGIVEERTSERG